MATFKVENIVYLESRQSTFFIGEIIQGDICIGMTVDIRGTPIKINGIESVDGELNAKPVSKIALKASTNKAFFEELLEKSIVGHEVSIA